MPRKSAAPAGHTGRTRKGHTRDVKVERVGPVTIYKRGHTYTLYYRESGATHRRKVDGNLAAARATAHKVGEALAQNRTSPLTFNRTPPGAMATGYLDAVAGVQRLALRTQDRYKAALDRFLDYCRDANVTAVDAVGLAEVEDFVKWLRGQKRSRNGGKSRSRDFYTIGGIKFILSTCRTAFNWAGRRRMLPPYHDNPFSLFPIDKLKDPAEERRAGKVFSTEQERAFFAACGENERPLFTVLAAYGLRLGELTHLLVEDVDLANGVFRVRSKPFLMWSVKTGRERELPLIPATRPLFERAIGTRKAGFVFLNTISKSVIGSWVSFPGPDDFRRAAAQAVEELLGASPGASERDRKRTLVAFGRRAGQIPERTVRGAFLRLTRRIGCPEFTRVHDFRHLFSTRAQAAGVNPILVQEMLGHTTLEMTRRYTHPGIETKREALARLLGGLSPSGERPEGPT